jgi:hypothetical protein
MFANLMPASGHQDHTALPSASSAFVKAPSASTASRANVRDDRDTPLSWVRDAMKTPVIWVKREVKYFCEEGWTGNR